MALTVDEGYPINAEQGNGGGFYLVEYRHPHKKILSKEQTQVLEGLVKEIDLYRASVLIGIPSMLCSEKIKPKIAAIMRSIFV